MGASLAVVCLVGVLVEAVPLPSRTVHATNSALRTRLPAIGQAANLTLAKLERRVTRLDAAVSRLEHTSLPTSDANAQFLKVGATASNADALGGMPASAFLHGHGQLLTNQLTVATAGTTQPLFGDGSVQVLVGLSLGGQPMVVLQNSTSHQLLFTVTGGSSSQSTVPASAGGVPGTATVTPNSAQLELQMFGDGAGVGTIWTVTLSVVSSQGALYAGQMLVGSV